MNEKTEELRNKILEGDIQSFRALLDQFSNMADSVEDDMQLLQSVVGDIQDKGYEIEQENIKLRQENELLKNSLQSKRLGKNEINK